MKKNFFSISEIFRNCTQEEKRSFLLDDAKLKNITDLLVLVNVVRHEFPDLTFHVTSWCRDAAHNKRAGGVSNSQHLVGGAVDFKVCMHNNCTDELNNTVYKRIIVLAKAGYIQFGQCIWYHSDKVGHFIHLSIPGNHVNQSFEKV